MKLAFVKQPWCVAWSWQSIRFVSARQMLDSFYYKTGCFSLLAHWRGDVWVMEESECRSGDRALWEGGDPEAAKEMWARTPLTAWADVPWGEYDVVVAAGRIVPPEIIQAHPHTLWTVLEGEHTAFRDRGPGDYDLFWDYTDVDALPYMVDTDIMRELVQPTNEAAVWLPSRSVRPHGGWKVSEPYPTEFASLPLAYPGIWNLGRTYQAILDGIVEKPLAFWRRQAACRYLLNLRSGGEIGQPIIEAAALGLIVISSPEAYSVVCHPTCRVNDVGGALTMIRRLEKSPGQRRAVLKYQDKVLREVFWQRPLAKLERAIERKMLAAGGTEVKNDDDRNSNET